MSVYLDDDASRRQNGRPSRRLLAPGRGRGGLRVRLEGRGARSGSSTTFADLAATVDALDDNPLPASYEVRLQAGAGHGEAVDELAAKLAETPGRRRRALRPPVARSAAVGRRRRFASVGLVLGARPDDRRRPDRGQRRPAGALHARRDEIEIMQLVGRAAGVTSAARSSWKACSRAASAPLLALAALAPSFLAVRGPYLVPACRRREPVVGPIPVARAVPAAPRGRDGGRVPGRAGGRERT